VTTAWPSALPQRPLRDGYVLRPAATTRRIEWEAGPGRQRRASTRTLLSADVPWRLTPEQFELFRGFYSHNLEEGTAWFDLALPLGSQSPTSEARFVEKYRAVPRRRSSWHVNGVIEFRPPPVEPAAIEGLTTDWPDPLPYEPVSEPYALDPHDAALRSEAEDGAPVDKRLRFFETPAGFEVTWRFDFAGFWLWFNWWRGVLLDGQRWATIPLRLAEDFVPCTCRFHGQRPWRASLWRGLHWQVSATLEVLRPPVIAPLEIEAYLAAPSLHHLVHVVLPAALPA